MDNKHFPAAQRFQLYRHWYVDLSSYHVVDISMSLTLLQQSERTFKRILSALTREVQLGFGRLISVIWIISPVCLLLALTPHFFLDLGTWVWPANEQSPKVEIHILFWKVQMLVCISQIIVCHPVQTFPSQVSLGLRYVVLWPGGWQEEIWNPKTRFLDCISRFPIMFVQYLLSRWSHGHMGFDHFVHCPLGSDQQKNRIQFCQ